LPVSLLAGCPKSTDPTPQIQVSPGAAARVNILDSKRARNTGNTKARVHPMSRGEELGGPNAIGKPGDWMIENDEVVFVIDALGGGTGFAESGGNLVDAADAKVRKDELGQVFTYFGTFPRQGVYSKIDARIENDGSAVVEARGKELYDPSLEVVTNYRLGATDRALLMKTTVTNRGTAKATGLTLGDAIQWGGTEKLAPGKAVGFKGPSTGPFIGGVGRFVSYAITTTEGEVAATSGGTWTDTEQKKNVELAPGASVVFERVFVVGQRPDVASIVSELTRASGGEVGGLEIALADEKGVAVKATPGSKVILGTDKAPEVLSLVATKEGDTFSGEVPPGKWVVGYAPSVGRRAAGSKITVNVAKNDSTRVMLVVSEAASVDLGPCVEHGKGIPCKLTIQPQGTSEPLDLGPPHVAGFAKNVVTLRPGEKVKVPLAHGRYRVSASRGPEYALDEIDVTVPGTAPPPFTLHRVVDTTGYLAGDFHQHSIMSADAPVATRDRVLANAAEGLELAVASEHNVIADLAPMASELGLAPFIAQIPGVELTSDASRKPFGHANVYPLIPAPDKPRNGAPVVRDRLAAEVFAEARAMPGGPHVLQINHPRSGANGYFDQLGFDPKTGTAKGAGFDPVFDAIEVWNGRVVAHRTKVLDDYFALLALGRPVTPIADTDTHGILGEEPGYPRTYVRVTNDTAPGDPARVQELVKTLRETRDVVLTNGPFIKTSAPIGGLVKGKSVDVKIEVRTAPWVVVDKVEIRMARGAAPKPIALAPHKNAAGAMVSEALFTVRATEDDAFAVIVSGTKPMRPVLAGEDAEIAPWAMTAPIWIDADGDGQSLGRRLATP
jgi:hypothetical protein